MSWDVCGYVASGLVLAAFYMKDMVPLRLVALASNLAFIAYGLALGLTPIWLLHALLLPLNSCRLIQAVRTRRRSALSPAANGRARPATGPLDMRDIIGSPSRPGKAIHVSGARVPDLDKLHAGCRTVANLKLA